MSKEEPKIQVFLSRAVYMAGQKLYGSIRLTPKPQAFEFVKVFMVGHVRVSCSRWHPISFDELKHLYGECHPMLSDLLLEDDVSVVNIRNGSIPGAGAFSSDKIACFFATNVTDVLKSKSESYQEVTNESEYMRSEHTYDNCCTFEIELPQDLPHSLNGRSCSYSYSCCVYARTSASNKFQCRIPVTILSTIPRSIDFVKGIDNFGTCSSARVKVGQVSSFRKWGLPLNITDEIYLQRTSVYAIGSSYEDINPRATLSMRITNSHGTPICILNVFGEESKTITPGGRIFLKFEFGEDISSVACRRICVCFLCEEIARFEDSETVTNTVIYSPQVHSIYEELTSVGISLLLPLESECTVNTDLMEISLKLKLELIVDKDDFDGKGSKFETLTMEIPYTVVHSFPNYHDMITDDEDQKKENEYDLICLSKRLKECTGYVPPKSSV